MQLTIDTSQDLDDVVRVVGALYDVKLGVVGTTESTVVPAPRGRTRPTSGRRTSSRRSGRRSRATTASTAEVRAWAQTHGYEVSSRGRIPATIKSAFDASQS